MDDEEMQDLFRRLVLAVERISQDVESMLGVAETAELWTPTDYGNGGVDED